jgi:hypothetical protein
MSLKGLQKETEKNAVALAENTWKAFLKTYTPNNARRELAGIKSELACVASNMPSLARLRSISGEVKAEAYVKLWLIYIDELLNLKERMSELQVTEVARLVVSEYYYLNIADLNLLISKVSLGEYGKAYDRLSINQIMWWFLQYSSDRAAEVERTNYEAHARVKEISNEPYADYRMIGKKGRLNLKDLDLNWLPK